MTGESRIAELFGVPAPQDVQWSGIVASQQCPFTSKQCFKVRKSDPSQSIGTCTVRAGRERTPIVICPNRLLAGRRVFNDVVPLLRSSERSDEFHVVSEVSIPGGNVDYFVVATRQGRVVDFVGVEFQALDTTGTIWPERERLLAQKGLKPMPDADPRSFGINWKMTAKTTLIQLHHKIRTFEAVDRKLVVVLQDELMQYMEREFAFGHMGRGDPGASLHFHPYRLREAGGALTLELGSPRSTDEAGMARALSLGQAGDVGLDELFSKLQAKLGKTTRWHPSSDPGSVEPMVAPSE